VAKVKETVSASGLQNRVCFHGRVSGDELPNLYQSADIFVLPSYHEGYGMVVVEAMQFGLPAIVSNITALPELVRHGVNGLLISPGDVDGIARAIDQLSSSPEDRRRMAAENVKLARNANTWEDVEDQFLKLVTYIMER
jgi:glycosyltransferase involved in cell wall biosynthesis